MTVEGKEEWRTLDEVLKGQTFPVKISNSEWKHYEWFEIIADKRRDGYPGFYDDGDAGTQENNHPHWKIWTPPPEKKERWVAVTINSPGDKGHRAIFIVKESDVAEEQRTRKVVRIPHLDPPPEWSPSSG